MSIRGVIYTEQPVSAANHALMFQRFITDGVITGCGISYQYNKCTIASGSFVVAGRLTEILGSEELEFTGTTGYARIKGVIDLTKAATETRFEQFYFEVDYASSASGFPALVQENVNYDGERYEIEWAVLSLGQSGITGIVRSISEASGGGGGGGGGDTPIAADTYTWSGEEGSLIFRKDSSHWEIGILSSGRFTFTADPGPVDIFAVGAGGTGGTGAFDGNSGYGAGHCVAGRGGHGGECVTSLASTVGWNIAHNIVIGTNGHYTEGFGVKAYGGDDNAWSSSKAKSGGAGAHESIYGRITSGAAGSGTNGVYAFGSATTLVNAGRRYGASGGGGGAGSWVADPQYPNDPSKDLGYAFESAGAGATTGSGAGGASGNNGASNGANASTENTGAGGGGGGVLYDGVRYTHANVARPGGSGASGILIIRGYYSS